MTVFTVGTLFKLLPELVMGITIKLMIDNGRLNWRDLVNDLFFWVPGVEAEDADGLTRQIEARDVALDEELSEPALAAK